MDFLTLQLIPPQHGTGLGGSAVWAYGFGPMALKWVAHGASLAFQDVLYIPDAMVYLILPWCLTRDSKIITHFDLCPCWLLWTIHDLTNDLNPNWETCPRSSRSLNLNMWCILTIPVMLGLISHLLSLHSQAL
jgi:hypothetical protein